MADDAFGGHLLDKERVSFGGGSAGASSYAEKWVTE